MTMLDTTNPRFAKAVALADKSGAWIKVRDDAGHCKAVGIPSSQPDRYYLVTRDNCDCQDFLRHRRACKHMQALEIAIARKAVAAPEPLSSAPSGLERILSTTPPKYETNHVGDDFWRRFEGD